MIAIAPDRLAALAGVNTPLGGFAVDGPGGALVTAIVSVNSGSLYADPAAGATVSGGGSSSIWIAGTIAQVNAKLAGLVYGAASAGSDLVTLSVMDALGRSNGAVSVNLPVYPLDSLSGGTIRLGEGTVSLDFRTIAGLTIELRPTAQADAAPALILVGATLAADTMLVMSNPTGTTAGAPRVAIAGQVELDGATDISNGPATLSLALGSVLTNLGTVRLLQSNAVLGGAGTLRNDSIVEAQGGAPRIAAAIVGNGSIALEAATQLTLAGPVAAEQTIVFDGPGDVLRLESPAAVQASISDFAAGDTIALLGIGADAFSYTATDAGHGVLSLYDGSHLTASLRLAGSYQAGDFRLSQSSDAPPAVQIGLVATAIASSFAATPTLSDVYRFFDSGNGTELLTQDAGERDALVANRPDLIYEGVAMKAVNASMSAGAVAVSRFFDTAHGTHFFTASASERDALIATRPDLVYEPGSTIYEHGTQQQGDIPVYRFFDTRLGTHFYTADAGERANIIASRPDLASEGIAFYAPTS